MKKSASVWLLLGASLVAQSMIDAPRVGRVDRDPATLTETELARGGAGTYVPGELVVRLDPRLSDDAQARIIDGLGMKVRLRYDLLRAWWLETDPSVDVEALCRRLSDDPRVEYAHANYYGKRRVVPNDPSFAQCWGLNNTGQTIGAVVGAADADIDAPEAWNLRHDATNILIATVDSGALRTHPDLSPNVWVNPADPVDGIDNDGNGLVDDVNGWAYDVNSNNVTDTDGHGSNVMGTMAARGNNGIGGSGVCWEAKVILCKDGNATPSVAASAAGIQYAAQKGAKVCNFSTGYGATAQALMQTAVNAAQTAGMVICVAAGNGSNNIDGGTLDVPAEFTNSNLLVVAASNNTDGRASFTSWGPVSVDIAAPGDNIYTTTVAGGYGLASGTSFASPLAAGCVALVRASAPSLTAVQAIDVIKNTADVKAVWNGFTTTGKRINLFAALTSVATPQFTLAFSEPAPQTALIAVTNATPNTQLFILISLTAAVPQGSGPIFGLPSEVFFQLTQPLGAQPFHVLASATGTYSLSVPGVPIGLYAEGRAIAFNGSAVTALTPITSLTF